MDTNTATTTATAPAPSENLSENALAARLMGKQVTSPAPAATAAATPQPQTTPAPAVTQPAEGETTAPAATNTPADPAATPAEGSEPSPETPAEPTEAAPAEPTAGGDEDDKAQAEEEAKQTEVPKAVKDLRDRVHKVVDQRNEAREQAAELQRQLEAAQSELQQLKTGNPPQLRAVDRFSGHPAVQPIDQQLANVDTTIDWCVANPDGGEVDDGKGGKLSFSSTDVARMKVQAERDRQGLVSRRTVEVSKLEQVENTRRQAADAKARTVYPWMANQQSPEFQMSVEIARDIPGIVNHPEFVLLLGDATRGRMARLAEEKKAAQAKPGAVPAKRPGVQTAPPNLTTSSATAPKVTDPLAAQLSAAEQEYRDRPTAANYQKLTHLRTQQRAAAKAA